MPSSDAGGGDALPTSCVSSTLTYATFGSAFLNRYCDGCHGFTQQAAQDEATALISAAVTNTYMPPSTPAPSAAERTEFGVWLTCGAP